MKNEPYDMKQELLEIDALLSITSGELAAPKPDIEKARLHLEQARENLLNLSEGLENTQN